MKVPKSVQSAAYQAVLRLVAEKMGVSKEDDQEAMGIGKKISMLVVLSGGVFMLGKMISNLRSTVGTNWNVLMDLSERHEKLHAEFNALAGRSDDSANEIAALQAEIARLGKTIDAMRVKTQAEFEAEAAERQAALDEMTAKASS
jgi:prefoldin subunit 5